MSELTIARSVVDAHGLHLNRYRGPVPLSLLAVWIGAESGNDPLALSRDRKLLESGLSQCPLAVAEKLGVDPWHPEAGCWIACLEALEDAGRWQKRLGDWLPAWDRNLWWVVLMDYSVGTGALRRITSCAITRQAARHGRNRAVDGFGLFEAVEEWEHRADLASPRLRGSWGRQTPEQIKARIYKQRDRVALAERLGALDGPPGDWPPLTRPAHLPDFPEAARGKSWEEVKAYLRRRRRLERAEKAPLVFRLAKVFREGPREPVQR